MHQRCQLSSQRAEVGVDVSAENRAGNPADTLNHPCGGSDPFDDTVATDIPLAGRRNENRSIATVIIHVDLNGIR